MPHTHAPVETPKPGSAKHGTSPCSCQDTPAPQTCCELTCFERPNYFCGHLLTDADLTLEQRYLREKLKLYHRSLDGHGIVCGLRLSCDPHCPGGIRIAKGFAIDECGNDLVVCEPMSFDVIGALRRKRWLIEEAAPDECEPPPAELPECDVKQCFHVVLCYDEEECEFTSPLLSGCRPQLNGCEPTRIRETVRVDLVRDLPASHDPLDAVEARLGKCSDVFSKGEFAQAFKENGEAISNLFEDKPSRQTDYRELFCRLRGLFLLYLHKHCDQFNCDLEAEIAEIPLPPRKGADDKGPTKWTDPAGARGESEWGSEPGKSEEKPRPDGSDTKESFCRLIQVVTQYVISCSLNSMLPVCAEPCDVSCVVLGTVEVKHGEVVQVCNCPRSYVWSFAHFFEVLLATLVGNVACEEPGEKPGEGQPDEPASTCCREFKIADCRPLVEALRTNSSSWALRSNAPLRAIQAVRQSLRHAFDLTRFEAIPADLWTGQETAKAVENAKRQGIKLRVEQADPVPKVVPPTEALMTYSLNERTQQFVAYTKGDRIVSVLPDLRPVATLEPEERAELLAQISAARSSARTAINEVAQLRGTVAKLENAVRRIQASQERVEPSPAERPGDAPGGGGGEDSPSGEGGVPSPEAASPTDSRTRRKKKPEEPT